MKLPEPTLLNEALPASPIASAGHALPAGARLDGLDIEGIIGEGSVEIVYAATDRTLAASVAIAEYMPARLALRIDESQVTPRTSSQVHTFSKGLKAFVNETCTLARCNHPSLVRIVRLLEANATAYRVMPRYPTRRLLDVRPTLNEPPDEESLRALLDALLGALQAFHLAGETHGKVTPSNILLLADNRPLLLGPGAAGRAIAGDRIDALMASEEPSFAPIEQLVEADRPLPPSVDLYALAGVARYWMSGELPAPAFGTRGPARRETLADTVQRVRLTWPRLRYSESLLFALDSALSIYPAERPQSVAQMRARMGAATPAAGGAFSPAPTAAPVPNDAVQTSPKPAPQPAPPAPVEADLEAAMAFAPDASPQATPDVARVDDDLPARTTFARQKPNPRRIAMWIGAVLVLLALLAVGVYQFRQEPQVGRVLEVIGINLGTGAGENAAVSTPPSVGSAASQETPPTAADTGGAKPAPTEPTAAAPPGGTTEPASTAGAAEPASTAGAPIAADTEPAKPTPTAPTSEDSAAVVAQPPVPAPPRAHVAQRPAPRGPASPREVCGERTQFSLYRCMQTQCSLRQWASHAQCERLRTKDSVD